MSLKFLCDQCVPVQIARELAAHGHAIVLLRDVLPVRCPDSHVIAKAREIGAILLSLNGDFADIVAYPPSEFGGIVALQLHNHPEIIPQLLETLLHYLNTQPTHEFYKGKLFLVEVHRIRVRR